MTPRSSPFQRRSRRLTALAFVGLAAGCGNLTVGGFGEASVAVSGDAPDGSAPTSPAPSGSSAGMSLATSTPSEVTPPAVHDDVEGHIEIKFALALVDESGGVVPLGDDELQVNVDLRGDFEAEAVDRQLIPATRYVELRVVFDEIEIEVQGLVIDGVPIPDVDIDIDDPTLVVTRALDLDVPERRAVELLIDLNALTWLDLVDPLTGLVDGAVFASLVDVAVVEP